MGLHAPLFCAPDRGPRVTASAPRDRDPRDGAPVSGGRHVWRNISGTMITRGVVVLAQVVFVLTATRLLGASDYGALAYALAWSTIFAYFGALGLPDIISKEVGGGGSEEAAEAVAVATRMVLIASATLSLVLVASSWVLESDPLVRLLIQIASFVIFFRCMAVWSEMLLIAHMEGRRTVLPSIIARGAEVLAVLSIAFFVLDTPVFFALASVGAWALQAGLLMIVLRRYDISFDLPWNGKRALRLARAGFPLMSGGASTAFLMMGMVLMHRQFGGMDLGVVALFAQLGGVLCMGPTLVLQAVMPVIARRNRDGTWEGRDPLILALGLAVPLAICACFFGVISATGAITAVFGEEFRAVAGYLPWLFVLVGLFAVGFQLNQILIVENRQDWILYGTVAGAAAFIAVVAAQSLAGDAPIGPAATFLAATCGYLVWSLVTAIAAGGKRRIPLMSVGVLALGACLGQLPGMW